MVNVLNQFSGGMSQDDQFIGKGQYIYSHGFDVTRSPWEFKAMPPIVEEFDNSLNTWNYQITSIFPNATNTDVWVGTADWKIRDLDWSLIANIWTSENIQDATLFLWKYYVFAQSNVYKYTPSWWWLTGWTGLWVWNNPYYQHPAIYQWWEMFFWNGNNVLFIDSTEVVDTLFTNDFTYPVKAVTIQGSNLRIYTDYLLSIVDIGSKTVTYSQVLPFVVNWVKSDWIVDYAITDADEMYICSWLEYRKICEKTYSETLLNYSVYPSKFTFKSAYNATTISIANWRVYTIDKTAPRFLIYGKKMEWLPMAFSYWPIHTSSWVSITNFSAIYSEKNKIYVGYTAAWNNYVWSINIDSENQNTCYEAVLITWENDFWDFSLEKQMNEIRVGKEWTTATLWSSVDGWSFEQIDTLDQTEIENKTLDFKSVFRKIALMFKLNATWEKIINADIRFTKNQL